MISYLYTKSEANPLTFDTQNAFLERPYFGEIQYGDKSAKTFPVCGQAYVRFLMFSLLLCSLVSYIVIVGLRMRMMMRL